MISPEKAEVERRLRQNKNDVEAFSGLLKKVEVQTAETNTKVDNLTTEVAGLRTDVTALQTDVTGLRTDVTGLQTDVTRLRTDMSQVDTRVGALEVKVDAGFDQVNNRFDRLEQLLAPSVDGPEGKDFMHETTERRLGYLETKVDLHRSLTTNNGDQLKQHKHMFEIHAERLDKHEGRFDHLDSQMTEVLGILRGTAK